MQVTVNERASHGLSFIAGYTYSHALSINDVENNVGAPLQPDPSHPGITYSNSNNDIRHRFTFSPTYLLPGMKSPGQMLQGWSLSGIVTLQGGLPWYPIDTTNDIIGTADYLDPLTKGLQTWNFTGPRSAWTAGPHTIPCYGPLAGCTSFASTPAAILTACTTAATAPYAAGSTNAQLALAAFTNLGCYVQGGGILTPPAFGTIGNANRNTFRSPAYYNVDFTVAK
jgi:hypothetical protein